MDVQMVEPKGRVVGNTERSWCQAARGGTGIAVLAILSSKKQDISNLQGALHKLQSYHPVLRSKLRSNASANMFSFVTPSVPFIKVTSFDISSTSSVLQSLSTPADCSLSPLQLLLEHALNENSWRDHYDTKGNTDHDLIFASLYALPEAKWVLTLRLHVAACDRTTAVTLLRELLVLMTGDEKEGEVVMEAGNKGEVSLGIEDLIPNGKSKSKTLWARGVDMLGYSVNSLRLTNLKFKDPKSPRSTQVVRLQIDADDTERILACCKARGIKLCGAIAAAGLMAAQGSKCYSDHHRKKYGIVTLTDCRSLLEPPLSKHHFGFYHSAILSTQAMKGGEKLWDLAKKVFMSFENSKKSNRHFTDMADLNFLMCKAIENPGLTQSSSLRTSFISVFEDTVIDNSTEMQRKVGVEDYMGCASIHGIGASIAVFDTMRDGRLDCACAYPAPLHSREQMQELVDKMKTILVNGGNNLEIES